MSQAPPEARKGADWMPDESSKCCVRCKKDFTFFTRWKYHCYFDGRLLCADCTPSKCVIPPEIGGTSKNEVRVCEECKEWCEQVASGKHILCYENYVLGLGSLSKTEIEKLKTVTALPDDFISGKKDARFKKITSIDLKYFVSVQHVGSGLLEYCEQLCFDKEVLAPLLRASNIKDEWLRQVASGKFVLGGELLKAYENYVLGQSSLSAIQLSKLKLVTILPDDFMSGYKNAAFKKITAIDISMLVGVREIGPGFLGGCSGLQRIDLKGLSNVTSVDSHFLSQCSGLQSIDLTPLSNVTSVDSDFLYGCSGLQSIDLKPLSNVTSAGSYFLSCCSSLQSVDLKPLSNVTSVRSHFLCGCSKLTQKDYLDQVDLTPLLHIPDGKIEIHENEDKENNLKKALQRVRDQPAEETEQQVESQDVAPAPPNFDY